MQIAWVGTFFVPEKYSRKQVLVVMAVFAGFQGCLSRSRGVVEA